MRISPRRLRIWLLIYVLACSAVWLSAELILGEALVRVFAAGTGCHSALMRPQIHLFPLSASVENVVIRHPLEPRDQGFRAKRVSIRLHPTKIFQKELLLSDLVLEGASAHSIGKNTGFVQTMAFLFPMKNDIGEKEEATEPSSSKFKNWLKSWVFHVSTIRILSDPNLDPGLLLEYGKQRFFWRQVNLTFEEQNWDPKLPYDVLAVGHDLRFISGELSPISLGPLSIQGTIGIGKFNLKEATLKPAADSAGKSLIHAHGVLGIRPPGSLDFTLNTSYTKPALDDLLTRYGVTTLFRPSGASGEIKITGSYLDPKLTGLTKLVFERGAMLSLREGCGIERLEGEVEISKAGLNVSKLAVEDLIKDGTFALSFEGERQLSVNAIAELDKDRRWTKSCLLEKRGGKEESYFAVGQLLSNSRTNLAIVGPTLPMAVTGTVRSEVFVADRSSHSNINAAFFVGAQEAKLVFNENGVVPQIQAPQAKSSASERKSELSPNRNRATQFSRETNSQMGANIVYDRNKRVVSVEKLVLKRFPLPSLLARVGPFLSAKHFELLSQSIEPESLIDGELVGSLDIPSGSASEKGGNFKLEGKLESTALRFHGVPISRLSVPFRLDNREQLFQNLRLETLNGLLEGELSLKASGIAGALSVRDVEMHRDPRVVKFFPGINANLDATARITGTLLSPLYEANVIVESSRPRFTQTIRRSEITAKGDSSSVTLEGTLLDKSIVGRAKYPLTSAPKELFELDIDAKNTPLGYFIAPPSPETRRADALPPGTISAGLKIRSPRESMLSGTGGIEISKLIFGKEKIVDEAEDALRAEIRNSKLLFTNVNFHIRDHRLGLTGEIDQQTGWNAELKGEWELGDIIGFVPGIEQISGDLAIDLRILGALGDPKPSGSVSLKNASLTLPLGGTVVGVEDGEIVGELRAGDLNLTTISMRAGGGRLSGLGTIKNLLDVDGREVQVAVSFGDFVLEPIRRLALELSGTLNYLKRPQAKALLKGDISVESAIYEQSLTVLEMARAMASGIFQRRQRGKATTGPAPELDIAVNIHLPTGVVVETPFAQAELRGDLEVSGSPGDVRVGGRISVNEGTFGLQSRQFEVISGQLQFLPDQRPGDALVSLVGETSVTSAQEDEYRVQMLLSGSLLEPRVDFNSDSGLRREEIQALLGVTTSFEALELLRKGKEARSLSELVNPASGLGIRDRLAGLTGFTSVQLETALSPISGEFVPRLVGKRPVIGSVEAELATQLGAEQASEVRIKYPLRPHLDFLAGWYTPAVTRPGASASGSIYGGIGYHRAFPGAYILPSGFLDWELFQ